MERDNSLNIQNDFFNQVRKEKVRVLIFLNSGKKLSGRIKSFDKFTVLLETGQGEQMIFKHAIATITNPKTFGNYMNFDATPDKEKTEESSEGVGKKTGNDGGSDVVTN